MELYIIRHGQTTWNAEGRLQGRTDTELNENGREAAINYGKTLAGVKFDKVFASPLKRARETAELILKAQREVMGTVLLSHSGYDIPEIITDPRLAEISFGVEEGVDYRDWHKEGNPFGCFFTEPGKYKAPEGGEEIEEVIARTEEFLKEKIEPLYETCEKIMIVAHGALNKGMMCYLEGNTKENFWGSGLQKNCEADIFEFDGKAWKKL
ncbi:MAG: histidine phosphatase family protein [Lachnospiraceae bacterium]|nr:histidine phosphatase family protein [Lachnospiraceae bacterium]